MKQIYNISLSIRDVGKKRNDLFVVRHGGLPEGNRSCLALNLSTLKQLFVFIKVRAAEEKRILHELFITGESAVQDVQVGPEEFGDPVWGSYFEALHSCSKSAALTGAAARAREARAQYKREFHE